MSGGIRWPPPHPQQIGTLIRALLRRGIDEGTFRSDLILDELGFVHGQLLQAAA